MAVSPSHRFGQIIGDLLELACEPVLSAFATSHKLYLDKKGDRPCRSGRKCTWLDLNGNRHDLDFVLERGGSANKVGMPVAFIETAWRRYTKHSRNKAQEIQGAVQPLAETFRHVGPFTGAILPGEFTGGALTQLKSIGFSVLYFPYSSVIAVFARHGINARFDEGTPDSELQKKVDAFESLQASARVALAADLISGHQKDVNEFMLSLENAVLRTIERIIILPLYGNATEMVTIDEAVSFVQAYDDTSPVGPIERYEIIIRYSNGDQINGSFRDKVNAMKHLRSFQPVPARVA